MQDIYNCIPETNHTSTAYSVAAVLCLQWNVISYFHISNFRSMSAVDNMAVFFFVVL